MNSAPQPASATTSARASWLDAALLGGILLAMLYGIGSYGLYEPHEGHFAGVGREMVTTGDWIVPHLNGAQYLNKPPLFYWLIALSYTIFGVQNEFAARLPLALIGWGGVVLVWHWARQLFGIRAGRTAAVMLLVAWGWYLFCHQLIIDALLSVLNLAALYMLWKAIQDRQRRSGWVIFYVIVGLAVLAKGLIGLAFPATALWAYIIWRRDWRLIRDCHPLTGTGIIAAVLAPWVILLEHRIPGTVKYLLYSEHYQRVVGQRWPPDYTIVNVNWWQYLGVTMIWLMPWGLLLPQVIAFCRRGNTGLRARTASTGSNGESMEPSAYADALLLLASAALLPIVVFLPIPSRLIYYSLPCVLPFTILAAGWWANAAGAEYARWRTAAGALFVIAGLGLAVGSAFLPEWLERAPDIASVKALLHLLPIIALLMGGALLCGGVLLSLRRPGLGIAALGLLMGAADIALIGGFSDYDPVLSSKKLVASLRDRVPEDCIWVSEGSKEIGASAGIAFYLGNDAKGQARSVYVMSDDPTRPPPAFPGPPLTYLIDHAKLEALWSGPKPVLFVTDYQRSDWVKDPPRLPSEAVSYIATPDCGKRRVYANAAAWKQLSGFFTAETLSR